MTRKSVRCKACKAVVPSGDGFCPNCGAPVPPRRPHRMRRRVLTVLVIVCVLVAGAAAALWFNVGGVRGALPFELSGFISGALPDGDGSELSGTPGGGAEESQNPEDDYFLLLDGDATERTVAGEDDARGLIEQIAPALDIENPAETFSTCEETSALGFTSYRFPQTYQGLPVVGRSLIVTAGEDGSVASVTGNYRSVEGVDVQPQIDELTAESVAVGKRDGSGALSCTLVVYAPAGSDPALAWDVLVMDDNDLTHVYVPAQVPAEDAVPIGEAPASSALAATATAQASDGEDVTLNVEQLDDGTYGMHDTERNIYIGDQGLSGQHGFFAGVQATGDDGTHVYMLPNVGGSGYDWHDGDANPYTGTVEASAMYYDYELGYVTSKDNTWDNAEAVDLYRSIASAWDFYADEFDRRGFDGKGAPTYGECHLNDENAFALTGDEWPFTLIVAATDYDSEMSITHEMTHSVTQHVCGNLSGIEARSLGEATCDIMAFVNADRLDDGKTNNSISWEMDNIRRRSDNPEEDGHPAVYRGPYWESGEKVDEHQNSTVISHAAYLMCLESGEGLDGSPITTQQLGWLTYLSLMAMPTDCTFSQFAAIFTNAASTLSTEGSLSAAQVQRVMAAFEAVEIPAYDRHESVFSQTELAVFDCDNAPYTSYTVRVVDATSGRTDEERAQDATYTCDGEPLTVTFPKPGSYVMFLQDAQDTSKRKAVSVFVSGDGSRTLDVYTDFGSHKAESEQATEASRISGTRDIALVLDVSSSMEGDPEAALKQAATGFVDTALEGDARIGLVTYSDIATVESPLTTDGASLKRAVGTIASSGNTNIEDGLVNGAEMLEQRSSDKKIMVLMSDGEPNEGKQGDELIAEASALKERGYKLYTVGFNEGAGGQVLLRAMASDGCHYNVTSEADLDGFFADIASEINGTRFMYARIACPVEVRVEHEGEVLSSAEGGATRTSFGTLSFEEPGEEDGASSDASDGNAGDQVKVLRLKEGVDYDISITGTGEGTMSYRFGLMDEAGDYTDFRTFPAIDITEKTRVDTVAATAGTTSLAVDEDGDGLYEATYEAPEHGEGKLVDSRLIVAVTLVASFLVFAGALVLRTRLMFRYRRA